MSKENQKSDRVKAAESAVEQLQSRFGQGSIMKLGDAKKMNVDVISTGCLSLDLALGVGGVPRGRIIEIYGPEMSGKSTVALYVIAEAQKKGGIAAFVDAEHALDPEYAKKVGVKVNDLLISQPASGEQALEIVETLVRSNGVDVIVIDSVAALTPQREIEGEMGDQQMGLQARLLSQACRKLTGIISKTKTSVIFINQTRMKIGIMFGCLHYKSKVQLADGTTEWIGRIVNQKKSVEILSYDWKKEKILPKKITGWYKNGKTDKFLQFKVYKPGGNGKAQFACTTNHPILTPSGWRRADQIGKGDKVMLIMKHALSNFQWEFLRGSLMGDAALSLNPAKNSWGTKLRFGHGERQRAYLNWKSEIFGNIKQTKYTNNKKASFAELTPLPELFELRSKVYQGEYKYFGDEFLSKLTPLSLAVWYMDDGNLDIRDKRKTKGRIAICIEKMHPRTRPAVCELMKNRFDITTSLAKRGGNFCIFFNQKNTLKFQNLIKRFVHPSMEYKLLPEFRGKFSTTPEYKKTIWKPVAAPVIDIKEKPKTRSMMRFDIGVDGTHNFLADGVVVHNSPETTTGGLALKFYSSVRIEVRKSAQIKKGDEVIGNRVRAKVVKNKVAPPFKSCEFEIIYKEGISYTGDLLNLGAKYNVIQKKGNTLYYEKEKLGVGWENAKNYLKQNPKIAADLKKKILQAIKKQD